MEERAPILANFEDFNQEDNMKDEKHFAVFQINFGDEEFLAHLDQFELMDCEISKIPSKEDYFPLNRYYFDKRVCDAVVTCLSAKKILLKPQSIGNIVYVLYEHKRLFHYGQPLANPYPLPKEHPLASRRPITTQDINFELEKDRFISFVERLKENEILMDSININYSFGEISFDFKFQNKLILEQLEKALRNYRDAFSSPMIGTASDYIFFKHYTTYLERQKFSGTTLPISKSDFKSLFIQFESQLKEQSRSEQLNLLVDILLELNWINEEKIQNEYDTKLTSLNLKSFIVRKFRAKLE